VESLDSGRNHTQKVLQTLENNLLQKNIRAVFFVQTHAPGRGETQMGQEIIALLAREGQVLGIHSGSSADHASHRARASALPYDADENGVLSLADGLNGLESDLIRARARIRKLAGSNPLYVRPTYGEKSRRATAVYRRQHLKMILWDIDSGDNTGSPSVDEVNRNIAEGVRRSIAAGKKQLVILFHDINYQTAANLEEYIATICLSARRLKKTVVFPSSTDTVVQILNGRTFP
jgi:peptidoglycan/xylan/chitin deacetylase (PgdA/CDA1 family)